MTLSRAILLAAPLPLLLYAGLGRTESPELAEEQARARCATRLSLAVLGRSPSPELLSAADPQAEIDTLLESEAFIGNFSRFVNSQLNDEPGEMPAEDATFYLARHVLREGRPWHELFDGPYRVRPIEVDGSPSAEVVEDPDGLGYFRSPVWMRRYAGNEEDGYRLSAAYRILQNVTGLSVDAVQNVPDDQPLDSDGRKAPACAGCHYDSWFALDKVARVLSRRDGEGMDMSFLPPDEGPQQILDGRMVSDDAELVSALVDSVDFRFRTCRLAFQYLYGRSELTCEAPLFDACVDAFEQSGDVRAALRTIATDPGFCE